MTHRERLERRRAIASAYASGLGIPALARQYGVCTATAYVACREYGIRLRPMPRGVKADPARDRAFAERFRNGESKAAIARTVGLTRERVRQIVARAEKVA